MPLRISTPFASCCPSLSANHLAACIATPANDDGQAELHDALVTAALRHFAYHGLDAARDAHREAESAFLAGKREATRRWLTICSLLAGRPVRRRDAGPVATR